MDKISKNLEKFANFDFKGHGEENCIIENEKVNEDGLLESVLKQNLDLKRLFSDNDQVWCDFG